MRNILITIILLLLLNTLYGAFTVIDNSGDRLVVRFDLNPFEIKTDDQFSEIKTHGMFYPMKAGVPALPYEEWKIAIPDGASLTVRTLDSDQDQVTLLKPLKPIPTVSVINGESQYDLNVDREAYARWSEPLLETMEQNTFRSHHYLPVLINPFRYDGDQGLTVVRALTVEMVINGNIGYRSALADDDFNRMFVTQVINPAQSRQWRSDLRTNFNTSRFSASDWWVRIETDRRGMFRITPSQLSFLPLSDIDPRTYRLFSTGGALLPNAVVDPGYEFKEIPILVLGEEDGSFDTGDYILFYGRDRNDFAITETAVFGLHHNPYSNNVVYWLTFGGSFPEPPLRMADTTSPGNWDIETDRHPETVRVEQETHRRTFYGFDWYMTRFFGSNSADYQFQVTLEDLMAGDEQNLSFMLRQEDINANFQHRMSVFVNNEPIYSNPQTGNTDWTWVGVNPYNFRRNTTSFQNGQNTLRIRIFRDRTDNLFFDFYQITYNKRLVKRNAQYQIRIPTELHNSAVRYSFTGSNNNIMAFKILDFNSVKRVSVSTTSDGFSLVGRGGSSHFYYVVQPSDLYNPAVVERAFPRDLTSHSTPVDNVIVTPAAFMNRAQGLADTYQQKYGISSMVVDQQDIFNTFNGGHPDPAAIKQFVRYAYHHYPQPRLTSMTLLGLGTIDWRNYSFLAGEKNRIMVYQKNNDVSDDYLGMIHTSAFPEIAIGRYPVRNTAELDIMLNNMRNYTDNPTPGLWRNTVLIVADDEFNAGATSEFMHTQQAQETRDTINRGVLVDKVLATEYEFDEFQNKPRARDDIFTAINDGKLASYYIGHGAYDKLGSEDYLSAATDLYSFANHGKLTLFMAASCHVGQFDYPGFESLAQKMVLLNNVGAIASIAGTRETYPVHNIPLFINVFDNALHQYRPIGASLLNAKISYTLGNHNDEKYALLGDPLVYINPPRRSSKVIWQDPRFRNSIIIARQLVRFEGGLAEPGMNGTADVYVYDSDEYRIAGPGVTATLTAPQTASGNSFQYWLDGNNVISTNRIIAVPITSDKSYTAVYGSPQNTYTLTVNSRDPNSGVHILATPADINGDAEGVTTFNRVYLSGTNVTLRAPEAISDRLFQFWMEGTSISSNQRDLTLTIDRNRSIMAVYYSPTGSYSLNIQSSEPNAGAFIHVSPADNTSQTNGTTPFIRIYPHNAQVTLRAAQIANNNFFRHWAEGSTIISTSPSITITVYSNRTLTAVYSSPFPMFYMSVASMNPNDGVTIQVSPSDMTGQASGSTPFNRTFRQGLTVTGRGKTLFRGVAEVTNSSYSAGFIVPDDVSNGNNGSTISYVFDPATKQDYVNYYYPLTTSNMAQPVSNTDAPEIRLYLGSMDFRAGDTVTPNPMLYARISDSNGINVTGSPGHNILLIMDQSLQPIDVTSYFKYDTNSWTEGLLSYQLSKLSEGPHTLQLIAFDNFNRPSVASTHFHVRKSGFLSIERLLIYPNPVKSDATITFILSRDAEITINLYTMTGRRIKTINAPGRQGFNQIPWDGRDAEGKRLANNTYFIKVRATDSDRGTAEKTERIVIYK